MVLSGDVVDRGASWELPFRPVDRGDVCAVLRGGPGVRSIEGVLVDSFWGAFDRACGWLWRRSGIDRGEVCGWLWLWAFEHPQAVANKWNRAGAAGLYNVLTQAIFEVFPDYRHHRVEVHAGLGCDVVRTGFVGVGE